MIRVIEVLGALNEQLTEWARRAAGVLLFVMLFVVMSQVVMRYVLGSSISWSEEVSKSLMVWSVFFVAPWAYRTGANVSIEALDAAFSVRFRAAVQVILTLIVLWVLGRFLYESVFFVARGQSITLASLDVRMSWIYAVTPVSFFAMLLVGIEHLLRHLVRLGHKTPPALPPIRTEPSA